MEKARLLYLQEKAKAQAEEKSKKLVQKEDENGNVTTEFVEVEKEIGIEELIEIVSDAFLSQSKNFKELKTLCGQQTEMIKSLKNKIDELEYELLELKEQTVSPIFSIEEEEEDEDNIEIIVEPVDDEEDTNEEGE